MRRIVVILMALAAITVSGCRSGTGQGSATSASTTNSKGTSAISFNEYQHDFGKVAEGEKVSYTFAFSNKGEADLIISSVVTTCGCTVPKYDRKPIHPGAGGNLEVVFDTSGKSGMQTKAITVKSNASKPVVLLKITAEVVTTDK